MEGTANSVHLPHPRPPLKKSMSLTFPLMMQLSQTYALICIHTKKKYPTWHVLHMQDTFTNSIKMPQSHTSNTCCHMKFGMGTQLDGCQHIFVKTQQLMAIHLHIYYFIPASHKPAHFLSFTKSQTALNVTNMHIQLMESWRRRRKKGFC